MLHSQHWLILSRGSKVIQDHSQNLSTHNEGSPTSLGLGLILNFVATCRAWSPACVLTLESASDNFTSKDWYRCPSLSFRPSKSTSGWRAGQTHASHAARSPSFAARQIAITVSAVHTSRCWCLGHGLMTTLSASLLDTLRASLRVTFDWEANSSSCELLCDPRSEGSPGGFGGPSPPPPSPGSNGCPGGPGGFLNLLLSLDLPLDLEEALISSLYMSSTWRIHAL